jgi:tetratricopeptide (TPR) repeat protein
MEVSLLQIAFLAGWLSVSVTNFWGFSVVIVQILMFLLPAMAITLNITATPLESSTSKNYSFPQIVGFLSCLLILGYALIAIGKYWLADVKYATGQNDLKAFTMTDEISYILSSYNNFSEAFGLNSSDPAITSDLAVVTSYISVLSSQSDATTSSSMAENALTLSQKAVSDNPNHPNYYKSRARTAIILSSLDPKYLEVAVKTLQEAEVVSPTDPRIPYNLGVVSRYQGNIDQAKHYFEKALKLKPDFGDAMTQLSEITSSPTRNP